MSVRSIQGAASVLVILGLIAAAVAVATGGGGTQVDQPKADVVFEFAKFSFRECEGEDGFYFENRVELTGTSTGDSRLAGDVTAEYWELVNATQGTGPQEGRIVIDDSNTGARLADGKFSNAGPTDFTQGVIAGRVRTQGTGQDEEELGDGALIANWRISYLGNGAIVAQIGGDSDGSLPTNVWTGSCKGKFETFEFELPPPDTPTAQTVTSLRTPSRR